MMYGTTVWDNGMGVILSKTRPYGADRCPNCGEYGAHYCGPSLGEPGFFLCKKKSQSEPEVGKENKECSNCGSKEHIANDCPSNSC